VSEENYNATSQVVLNNAESLTNKKIQEVHKIVAQCKVARILCTVQSSPEAPSGV
jgi:hypothetical protein